MKRFLYLILGLLLITSCNQSNKIEVTGIIENGKDKKLTFSELLVSGTEEIKTVELNKKGNFKFKTDSELPKFYQLSVSKSNFLTLLINPGEKVSVYAKANDLASATIKGSEEALLVQKINRQMAGTKRQLDSIANYIKTIQGTDRFEKEIEDLNSAYADIVNTQRDSSIAFIINNLSSLASIVPLYQKYDNENYVLYKNRDIQYIKIVSESLEKKYPESNHVKALISDKENLLKRYNQLKTNAELNKVTEGKKVFSVPEIFLPDQSGDSISLNKVNSKYILVNFWASWNKESISKNIELKSIYKKYHTKGFEIYQVSLDTKKENWTRAIDFDQLPWINVIDLNGRMSYFAKIYNVKTLPTSFLINPDREIVLVNPTKEQLLSTFEYALK
jgi:peroxiredoxin